MRLANTNEAVAGAGAESAQLIRTVLLPRTKVQGLGNTFHFWFWRQSISMKDMYPVDLRGPFPRPLHVGRIRDFFSADGNLPGQVHMQRVQRHGAQL